ncbi:MAG: Ig-like domain-containing protein, partial [Desulfobulbaceae bacterium]|nr:Ig-like domain-containing protein [Desulfobulbaceae bacterium]
MNFLKVVLSFGMVALFLPACGGSVEGDYPTTIEEEDTTPPKFLEGDPPEGIVTHVCAVTAAFDDPIEASSVTPQSFIIYDNDEEAQLAANAGTWEISPSSSTIALFTPSINLVGSYTVTVTTGITNT